MTGSRKIQVRGLYADAAAGNQVVSFKADYKIDIRGIDKMIEKGGVFEPSVHRNGYWHMSADSPHPG